MKMKQRVNDVRLSVPAKIACQLSKSFSSHDKVWKGHFYKNYENDYENGFRKRLRATIRTGLISTFHASGCFPVLLFGATHFISVVFCTILYCTYVLLVVFRPRVLLTEIVHCITYCSSYNDWRCKEMTFTY